jgi:hypothetical protein
LTNAINSAIIIKGGVTMLENQDMRLYAKGKGVPLWKVATSYGVSEPTLLRWLRIKFKPEERIRFMDTVDGIAEGESHGK